MVGKITFIPVPNNDTRLKEFVDRRQREIARYFLVPSHMLRRTRRASVLTKQVCSER